MKTILAWIIIILVVIAGYEVVHRAHTPTTVVVDETATSTATTTDAVTPTSVSSGTLHNQVTYFCSEGSFNALFTSNQVALSFSNGQTVTLPQAMSGSGIRYEGSGYVLTGKGNNASLMQGSKTVYSNCLSGTTSASNAGSGYRTFEDGSHTFTFVYPTVATLGGGEIGYTQSWRVNATTTGLVLAVVTLPKSYQPGTNFSEGKFTVGVSSDPSAIALCTTATNGEVSAGQATISGVKFAKITLGGAGAGNFYDTTSYRIIYDGDCYTVEYTIHSTNIHNYDPSQGVKEFDQAKVEHTLDSMAKSFTFLVQSE